MKHPALTRIFAIALAILCFIMLLAGTLGITGAREDNQADLADYERLQGRIDEYHTVTMALEGTIGYAEAKKILDERQEQHDSDASQHRSDLAMHSATRGGLLTGADALWSAQAQLDEAWEQYYAGAEELEKQETAFNEGYEAFQAGKKLYEDGLKQYEAFRNTVTAFYTIPDSIKGFTLGSKTVTIPVGPTPAPKPTPTPTPKPTPAPTPTPTPTPTPKPSPTPTPTPSPTPTAVPSPDPTATPEPEVTTTPGPEESPAPTVSPSPTPGTGTATPEPTEGPSESPDATVSPSPSPSPILSNGGITGTGEEIQSPDKSNPEIPTEPETQPASVTSAAPVLMTASAVRPVAVTLAASAGKTALVNLSSGSNTMEVPCAKRSEVVAAYESLIGAYDAVNTFMAGLSSQLPQDQMGDLSAGLEAFNQSYQLVTGMKAALELNPDPDVISPEVEMAAQTFEMCKAAVSGVVSALQQVLDPMLDETKAELDAAKAEIDKNEPVLERGKAALEAGKQQLAQAKAALEQGDTQIYDGLVQIWASLGELDDEEEAFRESKEALEQDAEELAAMEEKNRQQRDLENRQTSLRVMLMDRDGIRDRVDNGEDLIESAQAYGEELLRRAENEYQTRFIACVLMIIGGLAGISHIPAAFEKLKNRFMLISPVLVCLGCAAAAEYIFESMGRGSSYSAIFAGLFAVLQLLIIFPKSKQPGANT